MATKPATIKKPKPLSGLEPQLSKKDTMTEEEKDYLNDLGKRIRKMGFKPHLKEQGWVIYTKGDGGVTAETAFYGRIEIRRYTGKLAKYYGHGYFVHFGLHKNKSSARSDYVSEKVFGVGSSTVKAMPSERLETDTERMFQEYVNAIRTFVGGKKLKTKPKS